MRNLDDARHHADLILTALDGESEVMPVVGHVEDDDNPVRMLAVALDHAHAAISALLEEVRALHDEVDRLGGDRPRITSEDLQRWGLEPR